MGDEAVIALEKRLEEMHSYNQTQFGHGQKHFERLEREGDEFRALVKNHAEIIGSFNEGVLEGVNERAAFIDVLMERSKFWASIRDEMTRKSVMFVFVFVIAAFIFWLGFEDMARKIIGLG